MPQPLSIRLYQDPALIELTRLVGYRGIPYPISKEETERLNAKYGQEKMVAAADELLDYDTTTKVAKIKDSVRKFCRQLLGPLPEEWDEFYASVENPPPNPYKAADADKHGGESPSDKSDESELSPRVPPRMVPPPEMTSEEMIRRLDDEALQKLLDDARAGLTHCGTTSHHGRQLMRDIGMAEAEFARRRKQAGSPSEADLIRTMHGTKLRKLLLAEHTHARNYAVGHHFHNEAIRRMDLLESEMRRRGNKVPPRPSLPARTIEMPLPLAESEEEDDIDVVAQALANTIELETGMTCTVIHPDEIQRFRQATTHRLNELLDMDRYEVARYGPETVTHQDAAREIGLIEWELAQRKARNDPNAG